MLLHVFMCVNGYLEVYPQSTVFMYWNTVPCRPIVVCVPASDRLEKQERILRQLEEKRCSLEADKAKLIDSICTRKVEELIEKPLKFLSCYRPTTLTLTRTSSLNTIITDKCRIGKFFNENHSRLAFACWYYYWQTCEWCYYPRSLLQDRQNV